MTNFYVYLHSDPTRGNEPFYVGKGQKKRAWDMKQRNRMHKFRVAKILKAGAKVDIKLLATDLDEELAFLVEEEAIDKYGRRDLGKGPLLNFSDGGEGPSGFKHTDEYKKYMSEIFKGKKKSEETKRKMSEAQKIEQARRIQAGYKASPEARKKMSEKHLSKMSCLSCHKVFTWVGPTKKHLENCYER